MKKAGRSALTKKVITLLLIFTLFVTVNLGAYEEASAAEMSEQVRMWANVPIDAGYPSTLNPQTIDGYLQDHGRSEQAKQSGVGGSIFEAATANGINPALMFAMFWHETDGGADWKFTKANNVGGIRCKTGYPCEKKAGCDDCALWTKFETVKQGFQVKAEILRGYMEKRGVKTIQQMLEVYAPPSDNNDLYSDNGYIAMIGRNMGLLGVTYSDLTGTLAASGGTYSDGTVVGTWKSKDFTMTTNIDSEVAGVDRGEGIPAIISYSFAKFAMSSSDHLSYGGVILCLFLLPYISATILSYTMIMKGKASATGLFSKMIVIKGDMYGKGAITQLLVQAVLVIFIIAIYLTGIYLKLMGLLYTGIERVMYYTAG